MTQQNATAAQIERDISNKRAEINDTLDQLQEKFAPGQAIEDAIGYVKDGGGALANTIGRTVRENPVPVAMMGIALGWLIMSSRNTSESARDDATDGSDATDWEHPDATSYADPVGAPHAPGYAATAKGPRNGIEASQNASSSQSGKRTDGSGQIGDKVRSATHTARDTVSSVASRAASEAGDVKSQTGEKLDQAKQQARALANKAVTRAQGAGRSAGGFARENPLLVAGVAFGAGALLAALLPKSRREDRVMGPKRDALKESAQVAVHEGVDRARKAAAAAMGAASDKVTASDPNAGEESDSKRADEDKSTAKREASEADRNAGKASDDKQSGASASSADTGKKAAGKAADKAAADTKSSSGADSNGSARKS